MSGMIRYEENWVVKERDEVEGSLRQEPFLTSGLGPEHLPSLTNKRLVPDLLVNELNDS